MLPPSLPIGYAVDRYKRVNVLGAGIFVWSLMTTLAGLANSFGRLFGARIGVAVGEAVMAPVSVSLVSDYFPQNSPDAPSGYISEANKIFPVDDVKVVVGTKTINILCPPCPTGSKVAPTRLLLPSSVS